MTDIPDHEPVLSQNKAKRMYTIAGIAVGALVLIYAVYAFMNAGKETTDDAQVSADVVPVASRVAGQVLAVHIQENQPVHRGDVIAELDPQDAQVKVAQA